MSKARRRGASKALRECRRKLRDADSRLKASEAKVEDLGSKLAAAEAKVKVPELSYQQVWDARCRKARGEKLSPVEAKLSEVYQLGHNAVTAFTRARKNGSPDGLGVLDHF